MRVITFLLFLWVPSVAAAQSISPDIFGKLGFSQFWDDESYLSTGGVAGAGAALNLPHGFAVEALMDKYGNDRRYESGVHFHADITRVSGRAMKYFRSGPIQPYVGGSLGVARVRRLNEFPTGNSQRTSNTNVDHTVVRGGVAGVRFAINQHAFIRPEFEMSVARDYLRLEGTASFGFRF